MVIGECDYIHRYCPPMMAQCWERTAKSLQQTLTLPIYIIIHII